LFETLLALINILLVTPKLCAETRTDFFIKCSLLLTKFGICEQIFIELTSIEEIPFSGSEVVEHRQMGRHSKAKLLIANATENF
jgi:hypothetical protein